MENNNNNGRGIFYGVIGVATLVVAVIGATFAYFSASISSDNNAIAAGSTTLALDFSQVITGIKSNLIPVDETMDSFATGGYVGIDPTDCIDDNGNEFCSVYQLTVTNPSETTAQQVYARIDVSQNTFPANTAADDGCTTIADNTLYCNGNNSNLAFAVFKGTASEVDASGAKWDVDGTAVTQTYTNESDATTTAGNVIGTTVVGKLGDMVVARTPFETGTGQSIALSPLTQTLAPEGSATYTIVMWVHETGQDQPGDQGKAFAAGITFSTSDGGSGVTAVLSTAG